MPPVSARAAPSNLRTDRNLCVVEFINDLLESPMISSMLSAPDTSKEV